MFISYKILHGCYDHYYQHLRVSKFFFQTQEIYFSFIVNVIMLNDPFSAIFFYLTKHTYMQM